jgi:AMMECR1 domain-containing protein
MNYCYCAFDAIKNIECNRPAQERKPMFVTWTAGHELRGCIGSFNPVDIHTIARNAAYNDTRFDPITQQEIP